MTNIISVIRWRRFVIHNCLHHAFKIRSSTTFPIYIAREGERRGAVAVGVVAEEGGDVRNAAHLEDPLGVEADVVVALR